MIALSYSRSPKLETHIQTFDLFRREILCTVLPRQTVYFLKWEAMITRVYAAFHPHYASLTKKHIISILSRPRIRKTQKEQLVLGYKESMDDVMNTWLVSSQMIDSRTMEDLASHLNLRMRSKRSEVDQICTYLHQSKEHPLISGGISYLQMRRLSPFTAGNDLMSWLVAYLYFYASGANIGDLLVLEDVLEQEKDWEAIVQLYQEQNNQTLWLEYFSACVCRAVERVLAQARQIQAEEIGTTPEFVWKLTDRQKEILLAMDQPGIRMTNRKVQKGWNVSQITASRDLSLLSTYGLIYSQGKGRSVYYTRV